MLLLLSVGWSSKAKSTTTTSNSTGTIVLNFPMYVSGTANGAKEYQAMVDRFNTKYDGKYKVVIEPIIQDDYDNKIKQLAAAKQLPTLMYSMNDTDWVVHYIGANHLSYDFGPWLKQHPEIKKLLIPESTKFCTDKNGRVFCLPMLTTSPIGLFYNSAVYNPNKAIGSMTLDEFGASLAAAKLPVAFMTSENAWGTMLFYSALINAQPGGMNMLKKYGANTRVYCTDFSGPIWLNATTQLQKFLQKHSTSNTIGAKFADAQNVFMNNGAAVIMNGPWMLGQFNGSDKSGWGPKFNGSTVKAAAYPGKIMVGLDYRLGQYWIANSASADQKKAALAFIDFVYTPYELELRMLNEGNWCPKYTPSANYWAQLDKQPSLKSYIDACKGVKTGMRWDDAMYGDVASTVFPNLLPDLITGKLTPQKFLGKLQEAALADKAAGK
jgi:raffinose/stachyose/melibiose transport system substrate-binding protein